MNINIRILIIVLMCISCKHTKNTPEQVSKQTNTTVMNPKVNQSISTKAIVISVKEELIMPSDYLTMVMTVKTSANDTLVFADMDGYEKLLNKEITITYKLMPREKLLICFDCQSYTNPVAFADITSLSSKMEFKLLRLKQYNEDPYIDVGSTFIMINKKGTTEEYRSNDYTMIDNVDKMASGFHSYGIQTTVYPELQNRDVLELLVK